MIGPNFSLFTMVACGAVAWMGHTDASREVSDSISETFAVLGMTRQQAAGYMKLANEQQLSRQLAGTEPLNMFRLCGVPGFWPAFLKVHAAKTGGAFLTDQEKAFVLGFVAMGRKKMADVFSTTRSERQAS